MHGLLLKQPENPDCRQRIDQFVAPAMKDDPEVVVACDDIRDSQLAYVIPWETLHPAPVEVHHLPLLSVRSSVRPKTQFQSLFLWMTVVDPARAHLGVPPLKVSILVLVDDGR